MKVGEEEQKVNEKVIYDNKYLNVPLLLRFFLLDNSRFEHWLLEKFGTVRLDIFSFNQTEFLHI